MHSSHQLILCLVELRVVICLSPKNLLFINYETMKQLGLLGCIGFLGLLFINKDFRVRECQRRWKERRMT